MWTCNIYNKVEKNFPSWIRLIIIWTVDWQIDRDENHWGMLNVQQSWWHCCIRTDNWGVCRNLVTLLERLQERNLTLIKDKCKIGMNQIVFIGLILSEHGVEPTEEKVRAVRETEPPAYQFQLKVLAKFCDNRRTTTKVDTTRHQVAAGKRGKWSVWGIKESVNWGVNDCPLRQERSNWDSNRFDQVGLGAIPRVVTRYMGSGITVTGSGS